MFYYFYSLHTQKTRLTHIPVYWPFMSWNHCSGHCSSEPAEQPSIRFNLFIISSSSSSIISMHDALGQTWHHRCLYFAAAATSSKLISISLSSSVTSIELYFSLSATISTVFCEILPLNIGELACTCYTVNMLSSDNMFHQYPTNFIIGYLFSLHCCHMWRDASRFCTWLDIKWVTDKISVIQMIFTNHQAN